MLILKKVKEAKENHQWRNAEKAALEYSKKLIQDGWYQIPVEGAVFSENGLAIFYHFRDPYRGQMKRYKFSGNKEEDKFLEQQYQKFIQKYMDDFVIYDYEAEWEKKNMENYQRYNEYIDDHANDIIDYVDQYFDTSKDKIKQDILKMLQDLLTSASTHYVLDTSNCTYDNSGELMGNGKVSLNQTIYTFLEHEYTGNNTATFESGCGYTYPTYGDELNNKVGEYGYNTMKQLIKKYLEDHLKENVTDEDFEELQEESCGFDVILGDSIVINFNFYEFVFEFVGINDQQMLDEII